jgi:hypothetical protein
MAVGTGLWRAASPCDDAARDRDGLVDLVGEVAVMAMMVILLMMMTARAATHKQGNLTFTLKQWERCGNRLWMNAQEEDTESAKEDGQETVILSYITGSLSIGSHTRQMLFLPRARDLTRLRLRERKTDTETAIEAETEIDRDSDGDRDKDRDKDKQTERQCVCERERECVC